MHDALADRSQIVYDSYTPEQQLTIRRQLEKFIATQVCNTSLITLPPKYTPQNSHKHALSPICGTTRGFILANFPSF